MILKEGMILALFGLGLGVVGAYFVGRALESGLYGVGKLDAGAIGAVAFVLFAAAMLASWIPARRAASVEPMQALRSE
jgi:putative ABC transport system permease protein